MKRIWIVGLVALVIAVFVAIAVQDPAEAVEQNLGNVDDELPPETLPDIEDVLPDDYAEMEAAAQLDTEDLYQDLAVTEEEFAAQVAALSVAMEATAEEYAQKVYPGEDKSLPEWAAELMEEESN